MPTLLRHLRSVNNSVVPVTIKGLMPTSNGCAIFLGNDDKAFIIYVDPHVGSAISAIAKQVKRERPMTHDLMVSILRGLEVQLERVIINAVEERTFYARLILKMENELGTKIVEIDARPSDAMALAIAEEKPIYVARQVFEQEEDMSELLDRILREQG